MVYHSHTCKIYASLGVQSCRAQRTVIDVIVRENWLPSLHKTVVCCLASFVPKLGLDVLKLEINKLKASEYNEFVGDAFVATGVPFSHVRNIC